MDAVHEGSDLARILALLEALPAVEQATALRKFQERIGPLRLEDKETEAHSCGICRSFGLSWNSLERDLALARIRSRYPEGDESGVIADFQYPYMSDTRSLTTDALLQGLKRDCLLFQWIFALLSRSLAAFKAEVVQNGIFKDSELGDVSETFDDVILEQPAHILAHIDAARGLDVRLQMNQGKNGVGALIIEYDPDPIILEKLWMATPVSEKRIGYIEYEIKYGGKGKKRLSGCTTSNDPLANSIGSRPTNSLDVEDSFRLAREWLHECRHSHLHCATESIRALKVLPSKVIDIGTRFPIRTVKIHWTEEGETGEYVALSYCWGGGQSLITTTMTAQEFTDGIPISKMPKTIIDAINLTHRLGLRFLWVDALCIIQDDPEDVAREISKMAQIYQQAAVTISAASAKSVHEGFLHQRRYTSRSVKLPLEVQNGLKGSVYLQEPHTYSSVEDPIHLRAWTLQEHVLAQRVLLFGTQGIWWTCQSKEYSNLWNNSAESDSTFNSTSPGMRVISRPANGSLDSWRSMVRGYTRRFLTVPSDKLPAIAGIAAHYSKEFNGAYLAGLWEFSLVSELMWCSSRSGITRPIVRRAPSWSWASVDGEVHHDWCSLVLGPRSPQLLAWTVRPALLSSPFGSVMPNQCVLNLEAYLSEVFWSLDRKRICQTSENRVEVGRSHADALEMETAGLGMEVWALLVQEEPCRGLLLVEVDKDKFRRVGVFYRIWNFDAVKFERRNISII